MGRRKIEIKPITEERNRSVTFIKRKSGLFKKAHELAVLCQVELALVVITPDRKVHEYCTSPRVEDIFHNCQSYPVVEHKGIQDYSGRYTGGSGHDADDDCHEDGNLDDSEVEPEEVHLKKESENKEAKLRHNLSEEHTERPGSIADSRASSRPRLKVQIPQIPPPEVTPEPQGPIKQEHDPSTEMGRSQPARDPSQQSGSHPHSQQQQLLQNGGTNGSSEGLNGASPSQLVHADKAARVHFEANQAQHPQVTFPSRLNTNLNQGLPQSPGGFAPPGYPPYVPYAGYFNNYPMGYGYPAPPSALPGGSAKPSAGPVGSLQGVPPGPSGPSGSSGPAGPAVSSIGVGSSATGNVPIGQGPPTAGVSGTQRVNGPSGTPAAGGASGGRWSAYPQSPMAYFVPAPIRGGDTNQSKLDPGAISAAMPSRYMNEMLASPSNYFSMEWGVWDPQASAGPGGTARISPSSLPAQVPNGSNNGETSVSSPLQFVSVPGNERKRTAADENGNSKWRPKE